MFVEEYKNCAEGTRENFYIFSISSFVRSKTVCMDGKIDSMAKTSVHQPGNGIEPTVFSPLLCSKI